jgi:meso-butanediol dehydrogenase / (S,S)-butanediol dehydrogenase / diacetyl reductase
MDSELDRSLAGRCAIITGAGNGLGLAIAKKIAACGAKVLLVDCDPAVANRPAEFDCEEGMASAMIKDLAAEDAAPAVFQRALVALGDVDTLINNAAWSLHKTVLDMTNADFDRLVAINQRAPYFLAQEFMRHVSGRAEKPADPCIVNIASVNALAGFSHLVAYAGTKGALVAMTRAMAVEMASLGIRVNSISPAVVDTPMLRKVIADRKIDMSAFFEKYLVKRLTSSEEIAELVAYLCSPGAACVDGANWAIDGGYLAQ